MSQLESFLTLLHGELAMEADAAAQLLENWAADPEAAGESMLALRDLFDRCTRAVGVLGLEGLASYLQQLGDGLDDAQAVSPEHVSWLAGWREPTLMYVLDPAQELTVQAVMQHLRAAPRPFPSDIVEFVETLLAVSPQLPEQSTDDEEQSELSHLPLTVDTADVDPDLLNTVLEDSPEHLQHLEDLVRLARSAEIPQLVEVLREAQRIAHTLKGSMLIVGLNPPGSVAHRLEDILEFSCASAVAETPVQDAAYRDALEGIALLQQMVGHLRGEDAPPDSPDTVVQRLGEWGRAIRAGQGRTFEPPELAAGSSSAEVPTAAASSSAPVGSLRMDADHLAALIRKAGQGIARSQRIQQTLQESAGYLRQVEASHTALLGRLRELELIVARQVVTLRERADGFDPLEMDRYDVLSTLSRFISEAAFDKHELASNAARQIGSALGDVQQQLVDMRGQRHQLVQARLVPVGTILPRLRRNVQQTARTTGKSVTLSIVGQDASMDADILAKLTEPLLHIVRNAIDHGIEAPSVRSDAGKPETGTVTLTFRQSGDEMVVVCQDDGAGIDRQRVVEKARRLNLIAEDTQPSDQAVLSLILQPGFSVKDAVTEISGRGVGMDIVAERVRALRGRLELASDPGQGLKVTLHLPVASGMVHCVVTRCAGQLVALPSDQVVSIAVGDGTPAEPLASWMGWLADGRELTGGKTVHVTARGMTGNVVLAVDEVVESRELLIQELGSFVKGIPGLSAAALRPDGKPIAIVNVAELEQARASGQLLLRSQKRAALRVPELPTILVVDDSLSVRKSLGQLISDNGFEVIAAADGFEALEQVARRKPAVMLTDLEMPNLNGLELTRRVRASAENAQLPIIMITSRSSEKHRSAALEAGVDVVFSKPYDEFDLMSRIRELATSAEKAALPA